MTRYRPGDTPPPGSYWSPRQRRVETITTEGQALTGPEETQFRAVPRWAAPFLGVGGAVVGGLYVIFMPVIFAGMAVYYAGVGVKRLVTTGSRQLADHAAEPAKAQVPPRER